MDPNSPTNAEGIADALAASGFERGALLALTVASGVGAAVATPDGWSASVEWASGVEATRAVEVALRPRWVMWGSETALVLVDGGLRVAKSWDIAAVQRLLVGGWRMDPARAWAQLHDLSLDGLPSVAAIDLFTQPDDGEPDQAVRADGYLKPEWMAADFVWTLGRLEQWAHLALAVAGLQADRLAALGERPRAPSIARSESAAELLCVELSVDGLPMDRRRGGGHRRLVRRAAPAHRGRGRRTAARARRRRCCGTARSRGPICATPLR